MVFQDPFASLDPRRSIGDSIAEAGDIHGLFENIARIGSGEIEQALTNVGLDGSFAARFPHELSGGQRQRVGIARAILPAPDIVIADEPVSALDVSVQAQVLNLLADLQEMMGLSMVFISHDLGVVGQISDRVAVMYMGRIVETAATRDIVDRPIHPYTVTLMAARPRPDPKIRIKPGIEIGEPPSQFDRPAGMPLCQTVHDRDVALRDRRPVAAHGRSGQNGRLPQCLNSAGANVRCGGKRFARKRFNRPRDNVRTCRPFSPRDECPRCGRRARPP